MTEAKPSTEAGRTVPLHPPSSSPVRSEVRKVDKDDVRIPLPESGGGSDSARRRRHRPSPTAASASSPSSLSVAGGADGGGGSLLRYDYDSDSDSSGGGDKAHGGGKKKSKDMFDRTCPIGQFFLNPWLFLSVRSRTCRRSLASRCRRMQSRRHRRRRQKAESSPRRLGGKGWSGRDDAAGRTLAAAAAASLAIVLLLRWIVSSDGGGGSGRGRRRSGGEYPPVLIPALDFSGSGDVGGWMTPYAFPRLSSLEPMHPEGWAATLDRDDDRPVEEEGSEDGDKSEHSSETKIEHVKDDRDPESFGKPDYGGLRFSSLAGADEGSFRRIIDDVAEEKYEMNGPIRKGKKGRSPHVSHEYAFDDDYRLDPVCRRNTWWSLYKPNCNAFHEVDLPRKFERDVVVVTEEQAMESHYISHGYYRDVWLVENHSHESTETEGMALKMLRWKHKPNFKQIETVRKDALVMERLTASPRIIDMYGHCAFSVTVEALDEEVEEFVVPGSGYAKHLDDSEDLDIRNKYTVTEKVEIALAMAESIADLHGFKDGIIVHDDIQLCQWLRTKEGKLKLGDFNRAEVMLWDDEAQEYCKYNNGQGFGNYRAPEEFAAEDLNEQIDVFSMGNNIYALLTGLWVFYENEDDEVVQEKLIDGETAFIDDRYRTRSYAEGRLVEIMERCWKLQPEERATIFEVVAFLRETLAEHKKIEGKK